jgi:adenylate kinase
MDLITIHNLTFKPFISKEKIDKAVNFMAEVIARDLGEEEKPVFVAILNGSFIFAADLIRKYPYECHISFVKLASYEGVNSSGLIKQLIGMSEELEGKTVIILEDIIDTGSTLEEIYRIFSEKKLKQLKIATLFFKPDAYKKELPIDYVGLSIEDKFIVGYGLDFDGLGRNLPDVYQIAT